MGSLRTRVGPLRDSKLWAKVTMNIMPPDGKGEKFTAREKALLRDWILCGIAGPGGKP